MLRVSTSVPLEVLSLKINGHCNYNWESEAIEAPINQVYGN